MFPIRSALLCLDRCGYDFCPKVLASFEYLLNSFRLDSWPQDFYCLFFQISHQICKVLARQLLMLQPRLYFLLCQFWFPVISSGWLMHFAGKLLKVKPCLPDFCFPRTSHSARPMWLFEAIWHIRLWGNFIFSLEGKQNQLIIAFLFILVGSMDRIIWCLFPGW